VKAQTTLASAIQIGNPVSFVKAVRALRAFDGVVEVASEAELADASAQADRDGLFTCPHTGVALAALSKLAARGEVTRDQRVVVISTASGLKFADFKVGYHEATLPGVAGAGAPQHARRAARGVCGGARGAGARARRLRRRPRAKACAKTSEAGASGLGST